MERNERLKAPDKIYVEIDNKAHVYFGLQPENAEEYIRKDALLEWLEQELAQRQQWLDRYGEGEDLHIVVELKKIIGKLNTI